jgi:hypothetical protein
MGRGAVGSGKGSSVAAKAGRAQGSDEGWWRATKAKAMKRPAGRVSTPSAVPDATIEASIDTEIDARLTPTALKLSLERHRASIITKHRLAGNKQYVEICEDIAKLTIREVNAVGVSTIIGLGKVSKGYNCRRPSRERSCRGRNPWHEKSKGGEYVMRFNPNSVVNSQLQSDMDSD